MVVDSPVPVEDEGQRGAGRGEGPRKNHVEARQRERC